MDLTITVNYYMSIHYTFKFNPFHLILMQNAVTTAIQSMQFNSIQPIHFKSIQFMLCFKQNTVFSISFHSDSGRLFDKKGNLKNWWSKNSENEFQRLSKCFEDQYSNLTGKSVKVSFF